MSSEIASSETTPLRSRSDQCHGTINNNNNNNNNNVNSSSIGGGGGIGSGNSDNNSYNRNNTTLNISGSSQDSSKMDDNRRLFMKLGIDVIVLLCVGFPILFFYLWGDPYKRGFYCDDESLRHPYHDSTVRNWMLYIVGLALPIVVMIVTEIIRADRHKSSTTRRYRIFHFDIPYWAIEAYKQIGIFGFGAACSQLTTDIAKYSIGRLRPHFFSVCNPLMEDGTDCSNPINYGKYIETFTCREPHATARMIKEMRLSFPSGHSSFSAYTMVYCAIYLQARMTWRGSKLIKHFVQFLLIMLAWYTALSRVSDYKHHWSDALSGSLLGSICAFIVANYISDLLEPKKQNVLPSTRQEATSPTNGRI